MASGHFEKGEKCVLSKYAVDSDGNQTRVNLN